MKIFVRSRYWIEQQLKHDPNWHFNKWIISIFSSDNQSPFLPRFNVLPLQFDDVSEVDLDGLHFSETHAEEIVKFIKEINKTDKPIYVHCDAGVSRSGAVGYMLNEWFNKYIENNSDDVQKFKENNPHILPNPLVVRLLKNAMFGKPFMNIEVNDYEYNEDGEKIDHTSRI